MRRLRVLLDTDVLVDAQIRDLFLTAADADLIEYRWTEDILAELHHTLVNDLRRPPEAAERLGRAIRHAFADGEVRGYERVAANDPGDDHVLGAAIDAECDLLVTRNRDDFPDDDACESWDLEILRPDEALLAMASHIDGGVQRLAQLFVHVTTKLRTPALDVSQQLQRLERVAPIAALGLGATLDLPGYRELLSDFHSGLQAEDPRQAVNQLLERLGDDDLDGCDDLLTARARATLGTTQRRRGRRLRQVLARPLEEPDGWGLGSAHRPHGVDREIVKLVRTETAFVARQPTVVEGIVFVVAFDGTRWRVDELAIPDPAAGSPSPD